MRVGVPDDADRGEGTGRESGLLAELPTRRVRRALSRLEPSARKLPEAAEEPFRGALTDEPASLRAEGDHRGDDVRPGRPRGAERNRGRVREFLAGTTVGCDRALSAPGRARETEGLAELHDGLVERPGPLAGKLAVERPAQPLPHGGRTNVAPLERPARGDAHAVRLERDDALVEGEARDGGGDVRSDPGQFGELARRSRDRAPPGRHDRPGGLPKVPGARVVPRSLPGFQDVLLRSARQRRDVGEPGDERLESGHDGGHPGLLEEDLRDPHLVRVAVGAPREGPLVAVEPIEERAGERSAGPAPPGRRSPHDVARRHEPLKPASV